MIAKYRHYFWGVLTMLLSGGGWAWTSYYDGAAPLANAAVTYIDKVQVSMDPISYPRTSFITCITFIGDDSKSEEACITAPNKNDPNYSQKIITYEAMTLVVLQAFNSKKRVSIMATPGNQYPKSLEYIWALQ
nr:hypothetical protein [Vibrio parahaemolyticus]